MQNPLYKNGNRVYRFVITEKLYIDVKQSIKKRLKKVIHVLGEYLNLEAFTASFIPNTLCHLL